MDDDYTPGGGSHILASVSRVRVAKRKMLPIVIVHAPKPMWGFTYTKHPRVGEPKFAIVDEVRFTALCLIVAGVVAVVGFMAADLGLNRIQVRDVYNDGGHWVAVLIGGIFAMLACVLSAIQIRSHWKHWTHPSSQKHVVRILYMVPIYALSAWGSLTFLNLSSYIDFVRGVYEAFVIYTFMILLTKYLGGHNGVVEWMKYKGRQPWPSPMCCLKPVVPDSRYLYYLKYGALQYTISMPLCSLAAVVLTSFGAYEDGVIAYNNGYPYIAFIMNCSQLVSLYCLVWLYVCLKNELAPFGPLAKFMVVKAVVFATFWQGVGLAIAASQGWLKATDNFSVGEVQVGLQDFLVCIEMFIAACTHKYTFGSETYADGTLRLIMEQRALYLAEQSYKRGVDAQKAALAAHEVSQGLEPTESVEETAEEKEKRQAAMADLIRKNMDDDTEGDVLFNEELVDWDSGALPSATATTAGDTVLTTDSDGHLKTTRKPMRASAYDYVYAYELEHQKAEGVDEDAPGASPLHRVVSLRSPLTSPLRPPTTGGRRAKKEEERIAITDDFGTEEYGTDGGVFAYTPSVAEHGAASAASPSVEPEYAADAAAPADVSLDLSMSSDPYPAEMAAEANSYHQGTNGYGAPPQQHHVDLDQETIFDAPLPVAPMPKKKQQAAAPRRAQTGTQQAAGAAVPRVPAGARKAAPLQPAQVQALQQQARRALGGQGK